MALTRAQLRTTVLENLTGSRVGSNFYQTEEINDSLQDAYNEVVAKTKCLVLNVTIPWQSGINYYDPTIWGAVNYLGTIGLFDNNSDLWLRDDVSIRDFNRIRRDWELWVGEPQFWASHSQKRIAVCPALSAGAGTFVLWYYGIAPVFNDDGTGTIIANDMDILLSDYSTVDLLETAQEVSKAQFYLSRYNDKLAIYKERTHRLAAHQLLLRI